MAQNSNSQSRQSAAAGIAAATTPRADRVLDITAETCPMTFVRTRLALDALRPGQILLVKLDGAEPRARVPQTARELGHAVLAEQDQPDGSLHLLLRRA